MTSCRTLVLAAVAALAVVALLAWAFAPRPIAVELATATQGRFEASIDEEGRTRLLERYVVAAPLAGQLARIALREGDTVRAGDVVATLRPVVPALRDERTLRELAARVEVTDAQVQRAGVRIERARVGVEQAEAELRRNEQLARQGFVARARIETDRLALEAARRELEAATEDRHVATHELDQARAALGAARQPVAASSFAVRAPASGRVLRVVQASESAVPAGAPLIEIGDTTRLEVIAELLTTDALRTEPGARVVVDRWGGPAPLQGRLRSIEPAAFTKVSALGVEEQRVNVHIDLHGPPHQWRALGDGFRVGVRIVTLSVDDAVRVPASAVFPLPQGESPEQAGVFVADRGRARLVPVDLGGRHGGEAWVRRGLEPGTAVIVYPPPAVRDGARIAPRGSR